MTNIYNYHCDNNLSFGILISVFYNISHDDMARKNIKQYLSLKNNNIYKYLNNCSMLYSEKTIFFCGFINREIRKLKCIFPFELYNLIYIFYEKQFSDTDLKYIIDLIKRGPIEHLRCYISVYGTEILFSDPVYSYYRKSNIFCRETLNLLKRFLEPDSGYFEEMYFYDGKKYCNSLYYNILNRINDIQIRKKLEKNNRNILNRFKKQFSLKLNSKSLDKGQYDNLVYLGPLV